MRGLRRWRSRLIDRASRRSGLTEQPGRCQAEGSAAIHCQLHKAERGLAQLSAAALHAARGQEGFGGTFCRGPLVYYPIRSRTA